MGSKKFPWRNSLTPIGSILQKLLHGRRNVARLGQDHVLKLWLGGAESIHGPNAPDRSIQFIEKFVRNARLHFPPIAPPQRVSIIHKSRGGFSNQCPNGSPILG